ncbi:MAG: hypothetical protein IPK79_03415 [Vampirovibrionales bacterium]|nr:hypothetical protein [Vampirovibrionales bacterium]
MPLLILWILTAAGCLSLGLILGAGWGDASWLQSFSDNLDLSDAASVGVIVVMFGALAIASSATRVRIRW